MMEKSSRIRLTRTQYNEYLEKGSIPSELLKKYDLTKVEFLRIINADQFEIIGE